jgi:hypothetical protein
MKKSKKYQINKKKKNLELFQIHYFFIFSFHLLFQLAPYTVKSLKENKKS